MPEVWSTFRNVSLENRACASPKLKMARFPAAAAVPSRLSPNPPAPGIHPGEPLAQHTYLYIWIEERKPNVAHRQRCGGGAGEIRTRDNRFRKPMLYPSELQPRSL